jgi:prohibitin 1
MNWFWDSENDQPRPLGCLIIGLPLLLLFWFLIGIRQVGPGDIGLVKTGGSISDVREPGYTHIWWPLQSFDEVNVKAQSQDFSEIDASTRELQSVKLTGKVVYILGCGPNEKNCDVFQRIKDLYTRVGTDDIENRFLQAGLQDYVKEVTPNYPAADSVNADGTANTDGILHHREDIRLHALTALNQRLALNYPGIIVQDILIANMGFSDQYNKAIEDKQAAAQQVLQAQQVQAKAKIDAQTLVITAQGEADANKARQTGLTPQTLEQAAIQKWDGHLPLVVGSQVIPFNLPVQGGPK